ncbi:hypothetical protein [Amycolatopsis sp. NPDC051903]|uniref:hypothetical protein n=1 Tax=Amycolatopsis sp. NPDC051903 TaxID=3363936 RepID=UPI0037BBC5D2
MTPTKTRGWRRERTVWAIDTVGTRIEVTTGLTTDANDNTVVALAIGDGPSAVLDIGARDNTGGHLIANLRASLADLVKRQHDA